MTNKKQSSKRQKSHRQKLSKRSVSQKSKSGGSDKSKAGGSDKKIDNYVDQLCEYIKSNQLESFWVEIGKPLSERMAGGFMEGYNKIQNNPKKYAGKKIAYVQAYCFKKSSVEWKNDYLFKFRISTYKVSKNGEFNSRNKENIVGSLFVLWKREDLKLSKFSLKLLDQLIKLTYKNKLRMASVDGFPLSFVNYELSLLQYPLEKKFLIPF